MTRWRPGGWWLFGGGLVLLLVLAIVTAPRWLRLVAEIQASAVLGRQVTIAGFAIDYSAPLRVTATDVRIASTAEVPEAPYFARIDRLVLHIDLSPLLHGRFFTVPQAEVTGMDVAAVQTDSGANNYSFVLPGSSTGAHWASPHIGVVQVTDGHIHVVMRVAGLDAQVAVRTEGGADGRLIGDVTGSYKGQPVTGRLSGGAVLGLREETMPYPVEIQLANGQSRISLVGTVQDPLHPDGADLKLNLAGQDMAALYPLTGIPFPPTPPFQLASAVTYSAGQIKLTGIAGRLGNSDVNGALTVDTTTVRPTLTGGLSSRRVDLEDLAGFIGSQPGRVDTPGQTPAQRQAVAQAIASPRLIPNLEIDLGKIRSADFHIDYRADSILGWSVPFDTLSTRLDIEDGHIKVSDFRVGVGSGHILAQIEMSPMQDSLHTVADIRLQKLDVRRMLAATHLMRGDGVLGGEARIDSQGRSLAEMLARGNGELAVFMAGGSVSALVVDLSGIQLGDATLSALGLPRRAPIRCLVGDFALVKGVLQTRTVMLDTDEDRTVVQGTIDMHGETIAAQLRTEAKHFTIGTLPAPIGITGTLKDPGFSPNVAALGARGAAAIGLGLVFPPAALLPTIQFGIGEDNACVTLVKEGAAKVPPGTKAPPAGKPAGKPAPQARPRTAAPKPGG